MEVEDPYDPPESQPARPPPARTVLSRVGIPGRKRTQGKFQVNLANAGIRSNLAERQAARARLPVTQPAMLQKQKEEQEREKRKRMADDTWAKRQEELDRNSELAESSVSTGRHGSITFAQPSQRILASDRTEFGSIRSRTTPVQQFNLRPSPRTNRPTLNLVQELEDDTGQKATCLRSSRTPELLATRRSNRLNKVIGPGTTISNPVELSDDDDTEEERNAVESVWKSNLQTSVLVGEIWLSGQRLAGHGPSSVAFKKPSSTVQSDPTLVIEFTKYIVQAVPFSSIKHATWCIPVESDLPGFLSIETNAEMGQWVRPYQLKQARNGCVWITLLVGRNAFNELRTLAGEMPMLSVCEDPLSWLHERWPSRDTFPFKRIDKPSRDRRKAEKDTIIVCHPRESRLCVTVTVGDLCVLDPCEFLNDTIIDFELNRIREQCPEDVHIFSSFFYKKFITTGESYEAVKRWADKDDLFSKRMWLIPVNEAIHWTLAVVCNPGQPDDDAPPSELPTMLYYDSLGGSGARVHKVIKKYVQEALKPVGTRIQRRADRLAITRNFRLVDVDVPHQRNSYDCGIFLLLFADRVAREQPDPSCPHRPTWFADDLPRNERNEIRRRIADLAYEQAGGARWTLPRPIERFVVESSDAVESGSTSPVVHASAVDVVSPSSKDNDSMELTLLGKRAFVGVGNGTDGSAAKRTMESTNESDELFKAYRQHTIASDRGDPLDSDAVQERHINRVE
ncbi:hypothetical protein PBRA_003615 [Plasmodiophora brassicae]|nr:hypothetical protein PBRA_003615 [Plasmodiophora brassicae]